MDRRETLRYVVATIVGVVMWASGSAPWSTIGVVVIALAVLAFAWHRSIAAGREDA